MTPGNRPESPSDSGRSSHVDAACAREYSPQPLRVAALETDDLDALSAAFARWDPHVEQLGAGRFLGRLRFAGLGGVQLCCVETNRVVRTRGTRPADSIVFSPVTPEIAGASWRGRSLAPGMVNVLPPQAEMDHRTCLNYRMAALVVRRDLLEQAAATPPGVDLGRIFCDNRAIEAGVGHAVTLAGSPRSASSRDRPVSPRRGLPLPLRRAALAPHRAARPLTRFPSPR